MPQNMFSNPSRQFKTIVNSLRAAAKTKQQQKNLPITHMRAVLAGKLWRPRQIPSLSRPALGSVAGQFGEVLDYKGNHSERILAFNSSVNPISAGETAADDSLILSRHWEREIHKGRGGFPAAAAASSSSSAAPSRGEIPRCE